MFVCLIDFAKPLGAHSTASDFVKWITPALLALYYRKQKRERERREKGREGKGREGEVVTL